LAEPIFVNLAKAGIQREPFKSRAYGIPQFQPPLERQWWWRIRRLSALLIHRPTQRRGGAFAG